MIKVALAGNPNCGKTTLFNALTGSTAYVGNWPGVTVEKRSGVYRGKKSIDEEIEIIDLPGIYSLSPFTPEEIISRNYIINEKPDVVISVVDGTNLERNLYLTTQVLEMDVPVIIAINMIDAVKEKHESIDFEILEKELGVPVLPVSALKNEGLGELMKAVAKEAKARRNGKTFIDMEKEIDVAFGLYKNEGKENALFHAMKALENDSLEKEENPDLYQKVQDSMGENKSNCAHEIDEKRYSFLSPLCQRAKASKNKKRSLSDRIDKVLTHRWWALPIMALVLFAIFHLVFASDLFYLNAFGVNFGEGYQGFIELNVGLGSEIETYRPFAGLFWSDGGINSPGEILHVLAGDNETGILGCACLGIKQLLLIWGAPEWVVGFFYDGVLSGVAAVLGFVPQIMLLFFFFSLMEDSGYMARISFVLDRIFHRLGVSGRAFLPMIMGFGCGVPAMMNTRTLGSDKERTKTIRVIPFFTCGAKAEFLVTVAAAVAGVASFDAGAFTFLIYLLGVLVAFFSVVIMSKTSQREKTPPFIIELPSYHRPSLRSLLIHVWDRGKHFIEKAFTIILFSTVIIWFLASFGWAGGQFGMVESGAEGSILYYIGTGLSYLFYPLGFGPQLAHGSWAFAVASIQGIVAKENVTASLETLSANIVGPGASFEDLVSYSGISVGGLTAFTVFNMLTIPCFASIGTAKAELKDRKTLWSTIAFWLITSYVLGSLTFLMIEFIWPIAVVVVSLLLCGIGIYLYDRNMKEKEIEKEEVY
ncbi:MAG: ferrous iron transporter B [Bacilli bacterium]|nr:ferrous iron transporter B [Bacilli bacterium]